MVAKFRNILVTGGAGFIGSNFVRYLLATYPQVQIFNLDALTYSGRMENLEALPDPERHTFIHGSINQQDLIVALLQEKEIDLIVNFAAETHVDRSISDPSRFIETNINGTYHLLEAARIVFQENPSRDFRFHHISTDEVFGALGPDDPPFSETTPYAPNSPYAASKAAGDHLVRAYHHTYRLPVTITNCSNNYGPYQFPEKLIPLMIANALAGKPLPIYGDGRQVRDWLYVTDHCRAIWEVIQNGQIGETYIIGGGSQKTNLEIVEMLCSLLDKIKPKEDKKSYSEQISFVKDRPGHDRRYSIDFSKINRELGWEPSESLESGLKKTITWYLENQEWIQSIQENQAYQEWLNQNYQNREDDQ